MANKDKKSLHVKSSDKVIVLAGKDKGKTGNIKKILTSESKVVVEGVNMVTKAQKPQPMAGVQGGLIKIEAPMDSSKVMVVCPACDKPTRLKHEIKDDKKVRVCKKCGEQLDV
jgi:large subunit ribosomal protein L24